MIFQKKKKILKILFSKYCNPQKIFPHIYVSLFLVIKKKKLCL